MSAFKIRKAVVDDAADLAAFAARTFSDTFATLNTADDMAAHLASAYSGAQQRAEIESAQVHTLLGERDGRLAAYAQLRKGTAPGCVRSSRTIELWRFYVDLTEIGNGSARVLMSAVLGFQVLVLLGDPVSTQAWDYPENLATIWTKFLQWASS